MHFAVVTLAIIFSYTFISLILFMPYGRLIKAAAGFFLFLICLKYIIYDKIGGFFIAPDIPSPLMLLMETLYSSVVILLFLLILKDVFIILTWVGKYFGMPYTITLNPVVRNNVLIATALFLGIVGTYNSLKVPYIKTTEVKIRALPKEMDGLTIIQLTDIHIGPLLKKEWLTEVVERVNKQNPDIVVLTGDMIDGSTDRLKDEISPLKKLKAKYGIFGVNGNHEYYFGEKRWNQVFESFGIKMLRNEHVTLNISGKKLVIAGVNDKRASRFKVEGSDITKALKNAPETTRILLAHRPDFFTENIDLQLSGHTHGGHLFFLKPLIGHFNNGLTSGLYSIKNTKLYLSPGTGLWAGFSCRLGVPSEITKIILKSAE